MTKTRYNWLQNKKFFKAIFIGFIIMIIMVLKFAGTNPDNSELLAIMSVIIPFIAGFISFKRTEKKYRKNQDYIDYITPIKIEFLGNNQAFQTAIFTTYNWTQYTVKITYASGRSEIKKVKMDYLNKHTDIVVK